MAEVSPSGPPETDHYFSATPASAEQRRERQVLLAGRDYTVQVASGIFSPDGVDRGTAVLLAQVPPPPAQGTFLDLGCGWGPIALTLALHSPQATIWAVDVNTRALDLMRRNAEQLGTQGIRVAEPSEVAAETTYDLIWSNPPIRIGKAALHELLQTWLPRLAPGGEAYLVVAKQLGADSLQSWLAGQFPDLSVSRYASDKGFRVLQLTRPAD